MAAPTQVLPSWLTLSTTLVTLPDGSVSTSSEILRLPLTYFGPSVSPRFSILVSACWWRNGAGGSRPARLVSDPVRVVVDMRLVRGIQAFDYRHGHDVIHTSV